MNTLERILKLIKDKGITEKKFLSDLELDKTTLSQWKKGQNESYKIHAYKIADYFKVSPYYLLCKTDDIVPIDGVDKKENYPELYPGQAADLEKLQNSANKLSIKSIKTLIKVAESLYDEQDD